MKDYAPSFECGELACGASAMTGTPVTASSCVSGRAGYSGKERHYSTPCTSTVRGNQPRERAISLSPFNCCSWLVNSVPNKVAALIFGLHFIMMSFLLPKLYHPSAYGSTDNSICICLSQDVGVVKRNMPLALRNLLIFYPLLVLHFSTLRMRYVLP